MAVKQLGDDAAAAGDLLMDAPGSPVLGVVVLFACAQARYSVPEPRVCDRLRLRRLRAAK